MQEISDRDKFKARAELWTAYDHKYSLVDSKVDWSLKALYVHKNCRTDFFKESLMSRQRLKCSNEAQMDDDQQPCSSATDSTEQPCEVRKSSRHEQTYSSSLDDAKCIIF